MYCQCGYIFGVSWVHVIWVLYNTEIRITFYCVILHATWEKPSVQPPSECISSYSMQSGEFKKKKKKAFYCALLKTQNKRNTLWIIRIVEHFLLYCWDEIVYFCPLIQVRKRRKRSFPQKNARQSLEGYFFLMIQVGFFFFIHTQ